MLFFSVPFVIFCDILPRMQIIIEIYIMNNSTVYGTTRAYDTSEWPEFRESFQSEILLSMRCISLHVLGAISITISKDINIVI